VDAALTRDTLGRLLAEENVALCEFEALLDREHGALAKRDIDTLESLAEARQANIVRLLNIEEERRVLCGMHGYDTDLQGLARLISWCDPGRTLKRPYDECASRARKCRDLNDRNGILVGAQIKRVAGMLGALTGSNAEPRAYGPRGQSNPYSAAAGTVLSAEA
jgi:flagellar biosynthesis/type III secretory pathway chaperone